MKKFSKLLVLLLAIALIAAATAVIASAEGSTDAKFIVNGAPSEAADLAAAVTEAGDGGTVKLNADAKLSATLSIMRNIKIDLNGHKIQASDAGSRLFDVKKGGKLELCGEGTLSGSAMAVYVYENSEAVINAYGKGIVIEGNPTATYFNAAWAQPGAKLTMTGTIDCYPFAHSTNPVILVGPKDNAEEIAEKSTVILDGLRLTVHEPDAKYKYKKNAFPYIFELRDGADVTVKNNSVLNNIHGNGIKLVSYVNTMLSGSGTGTQVTSVDKALGGFRIYLDVDDSEIIAGSSGYQRAVDKDGFSTDAGYVLLTNKAPALITVDNSKLVGSNRTLNGGYTTYEKYEINNTYIYFNNVDFTTNDNPMYPSGWLVAYKNNIVWNGGVISLYKGVSTLVGTFETDNADPFSAEVKEAAKGTLTITDDLYVNIVTSTEGGVTTYTYKYYKIEKQIYNEIAMACTAYSAVDTNKDGDTADAEDWSGVLFKNVYFATRSPVAAQTAFVTGSAKPTFSYEGCSLCYNVYKADANFDGGINKYLAAYLTPEAAAAAATATPIGNSVNAGYTGRYTSVVNPTLSYYREIDGTKIGTFTESFIVTADRGYGVTEQISSKNGRNGYFKFSIPATHTGGGSVPYVEVDAGEYATKTVSESNGALNIGTTTPATYRLDDYKYVVQEFDLATDCGKYSKFSSTAIFRYTKLSASGNSYSVATDQPQYGICAFQITDTGKLNTWSNNTALVVDKTTAATNLTTDGSWNRISLVYELVGWNEAEDYTLGSYTRQRASFELNLHVYVNGEWFCSYKGLMDESKKVDTELRDTFMLDAYRFSSGACTNNSSLLIDNVRLSFYGENDSLASVAENYKASIKNNPELMLMPRNENIVGTVDGKICYTESELLSSIENGSYVELNKDIAGDIVANGKTVTVKLNGKNVADVVSATNKPVYTNGYVSIVPAGDDIYEIVFANPNVNPAVPETTVYAALGTKAVSGIDLSSYTTPVLVGGKNVYFDGWTFEDGKEVLLVAPSYDTDGDKKIYAIPVYADAAIVEWYDGDGNLLATEDYRPGAGIYSGVFAPETALPTKLTNHAWYDLAYAGYSAVELPESGVYKVYPDYVAIAKDGVPANIKLNLTLYTNYELNIFVPLAELSDYADSIRIVRLDGTSNEIAVGSLGECTVYGAPYIKFADAYGVADTSINKYKIYYTVGDVELSKTITYGVPYYASQVMQSVDNEEAKTLVMNMVNYANAIIKNLTEVNTEDVGARVYEKLLEKYSSYVVTYDDSEFLAGGSIYENEISKLTYDDKNEEEPLKAPSTWIASAGFYFSTNRPTFYIKFSETAENTENGIKKPNSSGSYGWAKVGLFVYMGVTGEQARPGRMYARYDDTGANAYNDWNNKDKNGNISYYTTAVTETLEKNPLHLYNMAEVININISSRDGTNSGANEVGYPEQGDGVKATYSLSAYIYEMLTAANAEGVSAEDKAEYLAGAEMAKALYAYAKATREYVK